MSTLVPLGPFRSSDQSCKKIVWIFWNSIFRPPRFFSIYKMIPTLGFQREKREAPVRGQHLSQSRVHLELRSVAPNLGGSGSLRPRDKVRMDLLTFFCNFQHFFENCYQFVFCFISPPWSRYDCNFLVT
jgi:hypothetical protein